MPHFGAPSKPDGIQWEPLWVAEKARRSEEAVPRETVPHHREGPAAC